MEDKRSIPPFMKHYVDDLSLEEINLVADIIEVMIDRKNYYNNWYKEKDTRIKLQEQLENIKLQKRDYTQENILSMKLELKNRRQKEFIKYLESEIGCRELISDSLFNHNKELKVYREVLQKYNEIIGN